MNQLIGSYKENINLYLNLRQVLHREKAWLLRSE